MTLEKLGRDQILQSCVGHIKDFSFYIKCSGKKVAAEGLLS